MDSDNTAVYPTSDENDGIAALTDVVAYLLEERRKRLQAAESTQRHNDNDNEDNARKN